MQRVDNISKFGMYSRLRFYQIINDENGVTRLGLPDRTIIDQIKLLPYKVRVVTPKQEYRPDLIAYEYLGNQKLWWIITAVNDIYHPFKDLYAGRKIKIPDSNLLFSLLM